MYDFSDHVFGFTWSISHYQSFNGNTVLVAVFLKLFRHSEV